MILVPGDLAMLTFDWTINNKSWPVGTPCLVIDKVGELKKLSGMKYTVQFKVLLPDGNIRGVSEGDISPYAL